MSEGILAVRLAREVIERYLSGESEKVISTRVKEKNLPERFFEKRGVFCTLHTYPENDLRGCIGYPEPALPFIEALVDASISAATRDPRFLPVKLNEMDKIVVEVSILTPPELISVRNPKDYLKVIKIGRDGLIVEQGMFKGLLLPQVPIEFGWDVEEFLCRTCEKAGLLYDAWLDKKTKVYKFSAQIFKEVEPRGEIKEVKLKNDE